MTDALVFWAVFVCTGPGPANCYQTPDIPLYESHAECEKQIDGMDLTPPHYFACLQANPPIVH
jgi:hypothetical protein